MKSNVVTLEGSKIKQLNQSEEMELISLELKERKRNREITDIDQMRNAMVRKGYKIDPVKFLKVFKDYETAGFGSLIIGRNGRQHRFKWNYSLKAIGESALSGKVFTVSPILTLKRDKKVVHKYPTQIEKAKKQVVQKENTNNETTVIYVPLRPDFVFDVKLPKLSATEADVICAAIKRCV
jgi:hypothetical protein